MKSPRDQAMDFIATYERPDADAYEKHIVRIARTWLSIMKSKHSVQAIVNRLVLELHDPKPEGYGCGWDDLREKFTRWAIKEEWLDPEKVPK